MCLGPDGLGYLWHRELLGMLPASFGGETHQKSDGVSPSGKAMDSESITRGFESLHPSHYVHDLGL